MNKPGKYIPWLTALAVFVIYLFTLAPSVVQIDSGELAAVQKTLGIAHPTGYPLFTILGFLFLQIPFPFTDIFKSNMLAAIWCSLSIFFFVKSSMLLLSQMAQSKFNGDKKNKRVEIIRTNTNIFLEQIVPVVLSGLLLAFSKTFWTQSTSVEVYSLQLFLMTAIIFFTLRAYYGNKDFKNWLFVAAAIALGFTNHMTALLILPFVAVLFFSKKRFGKESIKLILKMLAVFIAILIALYSYLPLRASANPQLNWGNAASLENLFRHLSGKQYQVWMFSSLESAKKQLSYFISGLPSEFAYVGILFFALGIVSAFKTSRTLFYAFGVTFIAAVFYTINYDIADIDSYFLTAYVMFCSISVFGIKAFVIWLGRKINFNYAAAAVIILIAFAGIYNYPKANQSGNFIFEDYTLAILNSVEPNSIIFSYQWDYFISPSYYFQYAEGRRKDITVIDKELLRRSWYYNQLNTNAGDVIKNISPEINGFIESLLPFEKDNEFNPQLIEKNYRAVMTRLVRENIDTKNFYIGLELVQNEMQRGEFSLPDGYTIIPDLLMFKVVYGSEYQSAGDPEFIIRLPENGNKYSENIVNFVCSMLSYRASYELAFGKKDRARIYVNKIISDFPGFKIPDQLLNGIK